jgi:hypothetical protein
MKNETKLKHTPAPWQLSTTEEWNYNRHGCLMVGGGDDGSDIVALIRTNCSDVCTDSESANARLIAAAPELLAALSEMVAVMHALWDHQEELCESGDIPRNTMANKPMMNAANMATDALNKAIGENQE